MSSDSFLSTELDRWIGQDLESLRSAPDRLVARRLDLQLRERKLASDMCEPLLTHSGHLRTLKSQLGTVGEMQKELQRCLGNVRQLSAETHCSNMEKEHAHQANILRHCSQFEALAGLKGQVSDLVDKGELNEALHAMNAVETTANSLGMEAMIDDAKQVFVKAVIKFLDRDVPISDMIFAVHALRSMVRALDTSKLNTFLLRSCRRKLKTTTSLDSACRSVFNTVTLYRSCNPELDERASIMLRSWLLRAIDFIRAVHLSSDLHDKDWNHGINILSRLGVDLTPLFADRITGHAHVDLQAETIKSDGDVEGVLDKLKERCPVASLPQVVQQLSHARGFDRRYVIECLDRLFPDEQVAYVLGINPKQASEMKQMISDQTSC